MPQTLEDAYKLGDLLFNDGKLHSSFKTRVEMTAQFKRL
jgi:hypothetical protein